MTNRQKPILFLDVDGAVCAYGEPPGASLRSIWGLTVPIDPKNHARLASLHELFEIIWCTDWEDHANEVGEVFGLPELPHVPRRKRPDDADVDLRLEETKQPISLHEQTNDEDTVPDFSMLWKLPAVRDYRTEHGLQDRPFAWIDDHINLEAREWASGLAVPSVLIRPLRDQGLTDELVGRLSRFAGEAGLRSLA